MFIGIKEQPGEYIDISPHSVVIIYNPKTRRGKALGYVTEVNLKAGTAAYDHCGEKFPRDVRDIPNFNTSKKGASQKHGNNHPLQKADRRTADRKTDTKGN